MAETKPTTAKSDDDDTPAAKPAAARPAADPSRHAASSDPAVQKLLAERQTHQSNLDALRAPADPDAVKAVEARLAAIDKQLDEL